MIDGCCRWLISWMTGSSRQKCSPVEWALQSQRGKQLYFGPAQDYPYEAGPARDNSADWWPRMVVLKITPAVLFHDWRPVRRRFYDPLFPVPVGNPARKNRWGHWTFWARYRVCDNLQAVYWLYNLTGDGFLLGTGRPKLHSQGIPPVCSLLARTTLNASAPSTA